MKNRKIILSLLLSILLVLLTCACSDNAGGNKKPSTAIDETKLQSTEAKITITHKIDNKTKILYFKGNGPIYQEQWIKYTSDGRLLTAYPEKIIIGQGATLIGDYAFDNDSVGMSEGGRNGLDNVKEVEIPNTVTQIGKESFGRLSSLKSIEIPDSVVYIGNGAFAYCKALENVKLPAKLEKIPSEIFYFCEKLSKIELPKSITKIGNNAFGLCESLKEITIPESVETIGEEAFSSCKSLTKVNLPNNLKTISDGAFVYCENLNEITIPKSVENIGEEALGYETYAWSKNGFTIKGYKGSAAEKYAKDNKMDFVSIG